MSKFSGVFCDDGLGEAAKVRYQKRRNTLAQAVGHVVVVAGVARDAGWESRAWFMPRFPLYQDPEFLFLTGLNQTGAVLVLDPHAEGPKECLYLPRKSPEKEFWDGFQFGSGNAESCREACEQLGIAEVRDREDLIDDLMAKKPEKIGLPWFSTATGDEFEDNHLAFKRTLSSQMSKNSITFVNIAPKLQHERLFPDATDVDNLRSAIAKSAIAFRSTLSHLHAFKSESDVVAHLEGEIYKQSRFKTSFPSIIAAGQNAAVLHYSKNDDVLPENGMLLMDFGVKYFAMHADISRTVPINGTFNPLQKCLYQIVLDTNMYVESLVKPGSTIEQLNDHAWKYLEAALKERFLSKNGLAFRAYEKRPHNIGHLLGHMVHDGDPDRRYRSTPLKAGQILTNEPGLYGEFEWHLDGKYYREHIGIRIEDDLLVTASGCENLTKECPKTIEAIEGVLKLGLKSLSKPS